MSTERERRRAKAIEKQKKTRAKAKASRAAQQGKPKVSTAKSARWPVRESLIGENWYEWGATVHTVLVRQHDDGTAAALFVEVDLADRGVIAAEVVVGIQAGDLQERIAARSEPRALIYTEPEHVAQLIRQGARFGERNGHPLPAGYADVDSLLGPIDGDESVHELHFGEEGEDDDTEELPGSGGLVDRFRSWLGLR
jgi:hypothetical protein